MAEATSSGSFWDSIPSVRDWFIENGNSWLNWLGVIREISFALVNILPAGKATPLVNALAAVGIQIAAYTDPQPADPVPGILERLTALETAVKGLQTAQPVDLSDIIRRLATLENTGASQDLLAQQVADLRAAVDALKAAPPVPPTTPRPTDPAGKFFSYQEDMSSLMRGAYVLLAQVAAHTSFLSHLPFVVDSLITLTEDIEDMEVPSPATASTPAPHVTVQAPSVTVNAPITVEPPDVTVQLPVEFTDNLKNLLARNQHLIDYLNLKVA